MKRVKQSYFNLLMIASAMRSYWKSKIVVESFLAEHDEERQLQPDFDQQAMAIKSFLTIQTCAFLEEYKLFFKQLPEDPLYLQEAIIFKRGLKNVLRPAVSLIEDSWKDIYTVRNGLLAHSWRKNGEPIMFSPLMEEAPNSPWLDEEFTLLIGIFQTIITTLQDYHPVYFAEMHNEILVRNKNKVHHRSPVVSHEESLNLVMKLQEALTKNLQIHFESNK